MISLVIQTNADFTPSGKRRVRIVRHKHSGRRCAPALRWYVGTKAYRSLPLTNDNIELSAAWKAAQPEDIS
jgi:hypothetical protein